MDKFIDTFEDCACLSETAYAKAVRDAEQAERDGYIKVPDWFPVPLPGYDYKIFGQMFAYMKPKPRLRHILRYNFKSHWIRAERAKRYVWALFREM